MLALAEGLLGRLRGEPLTEKGVGGNALRLLEKDLKRLSENGMTTRMIQDGNSGVILTWSPSLSSEEYQEGALRAVAVWEVSPTDVAVGWLEMDRVKKDGQVKWVGVELFVPDDRHVYENRSGESFSRIPKRDGKTIKEALRIAMGHARNCSAPRIPELSRV